MFVPASLNLSTLSSEVAVGRIVTDAVRGTSYTAVWPMTNWPIAAAASSHSATDVSALHPLAAQLAPRSKSANTAPPGGPRRWRRRRRRRRRLQRHRVLGDLSPRQPRPHVDSDAIAGRRSVYHLPPNRLPPLLVCSERADDRALVGTRRLYDEAERLDAAAAARDERRLQRTQRQRRADVAAAAITAAAAAEG